MVNGIWLKQNKSGWFDEHFTRTRLTKSVAQKFLLLFSEVK